jgi:hypothetical protein
MAGNRLGRRGGLSSVDGLQCGQGMPVPPQRQAWDPANGWSGWFSQTQPSSSQSRQVITVIERSLLPSRDDDSSPPRLVLAHMPRDGCAAAIVVPNRSIG